MKSPWSRWLTHFERNADRPLPSLSDVPIDRETKKHVARSLAVFQRGEAGEGRIAKEIWRVELDGIDDEYRRALGLFIKEEGRHARILGEAVPALGGTLVSDTWTDRLFVRGRRLAGIRLKLLVLCVAEVVGITFYAMIASALPRGSLRSALEQIVCDEEAHLAFHVDFFRTQTATAWRRAIFELVWIVVGTLACWVVLFDHRHTLDALGIPMAVAQTRFGGILHDVRLLGTGTRTGTGIGSEVQDA
jgi:hypothetical protein